MKKRTYTPLLFAISLVFSAAGHAQIKSANKPVSTKNSRHVEHIKADKKPVVAIKEKSGGNKKLVVAVKAIPGNNKKPAAAVKATPGSNKKPVVAVKTTLDINKNVKSKLANKKDAKTTSRFAAQKNSIAPSKSTEKKQIIIYDKSKHTKQNIALSKPSGKTLPVVSVDPASRKHTIIASKSIESISENINNQKKIKINTSPSIEVDEVDETESDQITRLNTEKPFLPIVIERSQPTKINTAHVSIETSLFLDGLEADLSKELILQLTDIFAWDIDFASNLRPGDQFTVVYGKKIVDGEESDSDEIIAAEFINQGISYTALRYINESGVASYYTPEGESMQRAFLSTPVDFARISSPFDMHRKHPILNRIRAHKGIDYAARTGTPVKTTGDGVVTFSGRNGAYGQIVIIQHNDRYETLYAHLSDFKKGLTAGTHVKQGDVIGYVGQTGLATGPHLHYEFHVDGLYRDPESVKIPHSAPISNALLADFNAQTQPYFIQLKQVKAKNLLAKTHSVSVIAPDNALPAAPMQSSGYD